MNLVACGRYIVLPPELTGWMKTSLGPRGTWLSGMIKPGTEWLRPTEYTAMIPELRHALLVRKAELEAEFTRTNRLPRDAEAAARVLASAMPSRLARDVVLRAIDEMLVLIGDALRSGESIECDEEEYVPARRAVTDPSDEE